MCFCVSIYPYKVSFCHFPDNFCFGFLKYFSKSNELTISPGWLAFTVNIWLIYGIFRIIWPLEKTLIKSVVLTISDFQLFTNSLCMREKKEENF